MRNETMPTGSATISQNAFTAASPSGAIVRQRVQKVDRRQVLNDQQALESLLAVAFAVVGNCFPDASKKTHDAFDELSRILRRYVAAILTLRGIPNPWLLAEDIVQDLFLRLLQSNLAKKYNHAIASRRIFLFGVLRHVLSEALRKQKPNGIVPLPDDLEDPTPKPDEALALREIRDQLSAAIGRLRPHSADAFRAQYGLEMQSEEESKLSASTRNSRRSRARRALRLDLEKVMAL